MRLFISYRRDDTAGRAGRLFDMLVSRFGRRNVFQDVAAIAPGADFTEQVANAIAKCDAALVVIGPEWLDLRSPDGTRRLDESDDYVRREVHTALTAGVPVVPVLVGAAELPAAADLPDELRPLVNRQAARLRDETWHQDVDALVRRLEGDEIVGTPRRRWPLIAGAAAAAVAVVIAGVVWLTRDDGGDGDDDGGGSSSIPGCSEPDASWTPIPLGGDPSGAGSAGDESFSAVVESGFFQAQDAGRTLIVLRVAFTNDGGVDQYYSAATIDGLLVNQFPVGPPSCYSRLTPAEDTEPGEGALALVGWEGEFDLTDASLTLEVSSDAVEFDVEVVG
jgi:hypothetical protein